MKTMRWASGVLTRSPLAAGLMSGEGSMEPRIIAALATSDSNLSRSAKSSEILLVARR